MAEIEVVSKILFSTLTRIAIRIDSFYDKVKSSESKKKCEKRKSVVSLEELTGSSKRKLAKACVEG